jgi:hypothetical protein
LLLKYETAKISTNQELAASKISMQPGFPAHSAHHPAQNCKVSPQAANKGAKQKAHNQELPNQREITTDI